MRIQDGCSFSCAFCVIPHVRGATRSRTAAAVLAEIRRRVDQGHREIVLTGVNLGCFRDRAAGYTLARLVREAGAVPGVERLRLSSIEVNHVDDELAAAVRETPTVSPHLHVPLQSGDDGVLRAMGRRYTASGFARRLERLDGVHLTTDVIVGFPAEDEPAFARTLELVERLGMTKVHVFPYSPRPGTRTAADDACRRGEARAGRPAARALRRALPTSLAGPGRLDDRVLLDRPGRGYADDYTPWLVEGVEGTFVDRARDRASPTRGCSPLPPEGSDCLFCSLVRDGEHVNRADGFVAIRDIAPQAPTHLLVLPERHVDTFREIGEFPPDEAKRMLEFVADTARKAGLEDYRVQVHVGPGAGQTVFHLHWHIMGGQPT